MKSAEGDFVSISFTSPLSAQLLFLMLMDVQTLVFREVEEAKDMRPHMVLKQRASVQGAVSRGGRQAYCEVIEDPPP